MPGYQIPFRCDRTCGSRDGGVAAYVPVGLNATRVDLSGALEAVCIQVQLGHRRVVDIVAVYRPPKFEMLDFIDKLENNLSKIQGSASCPVCIAGNFNAKHSAWFAGQKTDAAARLSEGFAMANDLSQTVALMALHMLWMVTLLLNLT